MTPKQLAEDEESPGEGLPPTLLAILRDQSVIVPQDGAVWARLAQWNNAPCNTASAEIAPTTIPPCFGCWTPQAMARQAVRQGQDPEDAANKIAARVEQLRRPSPTTQPPSSESGNNDPRP